MDLREIYTLLLELRDRIVSLTKKVDNLKNKEGE